MLKRLEFANKEDARTLRRVLFCIAKVLAGKTFTARQICDLVSLLPKGLGKGREELCVQLFSRCCDPENFEHGVFPLLCEESQYELQLRLGILNLWNPCFPERNYILNLAVMDERKLADHLLAFDEVEKSYDKQEHLDQVHIFLTRDNISFGKPKTLPKSSADTNRMMRRDTAHHSIAAGAASNSGKIGIDEMVSKQRDTLNSKKKDSEETPILDFYAKGL